MKPHILEMSQQLHQAPFILYMKGDKQYIITQEFLNKLNKFYDTEDLVWVLVEIRSGCKLVAFAKNEEPEEKSTVSQVYFYLVLLIAGLMLFAVYQQYRK